MNDKTTLITGGTGKTGRRVAERLKARGVPVRVGSRSGEHRFDWEDASTWARALKNVKRVYLVYYPDLAALGAVTAIRGFTQLAIESGVERIVLLSGRGEEEAQRCEAIVRNCGLEWTIVRASWFSQNFSEGYMLDSVKAGEVALPVRDVPEPFVDTDDIADVAVAALTEDRHVGQLYEVTGPRLLTFADAVGEISKATGREVQFVPVTLEQFTSTMDQLGLPAEVTGLLSYLFTEVLDGRNASLADGVQRALGRAPKDFADFARDVARTGVWA